MPAICKPGKVKNPESGRCVYRNSPVLRKKNLIRKSPIKLPKKSPIKSPVYNNYIPNGPIGPFGPVGPIGPKKSIKPRMIMSCGPNLYINPKSLRCVQFKNKDVQAHLKRGYVLETPLDPSLVDVRIDKYKVPSVIPYVKPYSPVGPVGPAGPADPVNPVKLNKVNINNPNVDTDVKVLVPPPQIKPGVKTLIYCGPGKVINPVGGRCVLLKGDVGKRLTSGPYVIVNPPAMPPKGPVVTKNKDVKINIPKPKLNKHLTALDIDGDGYVSIKEYLDTVESLGPAELGGKGENFAYYNQRDLGIVFILDLIKNFNGPVSKIGCIPLFTLCVYKDSTGNFYTRKSNIGSPGCDVTSSEYYAGNLVNSYASIAILNAPKYNTSKSPIILTPPNLRETLNKCEQDGKYMIVCDLTLLGGDSFNDTSHANVLVFDIRRKTIERFDPHGGNYYSNVTLAYDPESNIGYGRKDFKFGIVNKQIRSTALFNQETIDLKLKQKFAVELSEYTFNGTNITTPYLGPQIKADEFNGLCVTWSCMYMLMRLLNPDMKPADVTIKMIDGTPKEIKNRILRFQKFIIRRLKNVKNNLKE